MLNSNFWHDKIKSKNIVKEKKLFENLINSFKTSAQKLEELNELYELALQENNQEIQNEIFMNIKDLKNLAKKNEINCFLSNEADLT